MQQFTNSRRMLGAMGPIPGGARHKEKHKSGDEESCKKVFMPPTSKKLRGHIGLGLSVQCSE